MPGKIDSYAFDVNNAAETGLKPVSTPYYEHMRFHHAHHLIINITGQDIFMRIVRIITLGCFFTWMPRENMCNKNNSIAE